MVDNAERQSYNALAWFPQAIGGASCSTMGNQAMLLLRTFRQPSRGCHKAAEMCAVMRSWRLFAFIREWVGKIMDEGERTWYSFRRNGRESVADFARFGGTLLWGGLVCLPDPGLGIRTHQVVSASVCDLVSRQLAFLFAARLRTGVDGGERMRYSSFVVGLQAVPGVPWTLGPTRPSKRVLSGLPGDSGS